MVLLLTVNLVAVREHYDVFTENKRTDCYIRSEIFGNVAYFAVGAKMVGSVLMTADGKSGGELMDKFQEMEYSVFGGSTVVLFLPRSAFVLMKICW